MEFEIKLLATEDGRSPFEVWYNAIRDNQVRARIRSRITRIRAGNFGDCKSVGEGVNELRLDFGPGYRIYYSVANQTVVILLVGGDKATQDKDIANARKLCQEYKNAAERVQREF
jgi:putative addiction module killer protein